VKSILFLSPHTDDIEIGAGGLIQHAVAQNYNIEVIYFSNCEQSLIEHGFPKNVLVDESMKAMAVLGVSLRDINYLNYEQRKFESHVAEMTDYLYKTYRPMKFDFVIGPWIGSVHQDHKTVAEAMMRVFRRSPTTVMMYEVFDAEGFIPNFFMPLSDKELNLKMEAFDQYKSQALIRMYDSSHIKAVAHFRGLNIGAQYAEAYVVNKGMFSLPIG